VVNVEGMEQWGERGRGGDDKEVKEEKSIKQKSGESEKKVGQERNKQIIISANGNKG
jgi:hypothetical protein